MLIKTILWFIGLKLILCFSIYKDQDDSEVDELRKRMSINKDVFVLSNKLGITFNTCIPNNNVIFMLLSDLARIKQDHKTNIIVIFSLFLSIVQDTDYCYFYILLIGIILDRYFEIEADTIACNYCTEEERLSALLYFKQLESQSCLETFLYGNRINRNIKMLRKKLK